MRRLRCFRQRGGFGLGVSVSWRFTSLDVELGPLLIRFDFGRGPF